MPSIPQQLLKSLSHLDGFDEEAFIQAHHQENKLTSIRKNPFKPVELDFEVNEAVPWNSRGFYLHSRPSFTHDPLFQAGCYYPQEAGSMFLEYALKTHFNFSEKLKILDVCAAPGGKSTLITSLLNKESILVANEVVKSRAEVLVQNLSKWGTSNTLVVNNETSRFSELPSFFDGIVIDAPCSGSGLFRKQPEAINEWSPEHVDACARRQLKILEDVLPGLKEGGILVYSTCSYSTAENEEVVQWLIDIQEMEYLTLPINPEWGIVETKLGYRFYPHLTQSEGFFCAVLRKRQDSGTWYSGKKKPGIDPLKAERALLLPYIGDTEDALMKVNSQLHLLNEEAAVFLKSFGKQFYFKKAGVVIGEMKGKDLVPNQELSWFSKPPAGIKKVNVDKETALKFLRKENFSLEEPLNGLVLICYKQQGLGWAKILPNRINNYFPNELRILK